MTPARRSVTARAILPLCAAVTAANLATASTTTAPTITTRAAHQAPLTTTALPPAPATGVYPGDNLQATNLTPITIYTYTGAGQIITTCNYAKITGKISIGHQTGTVTSATIGNPQGQPCTNARDYDGYSFGQTTVTIQSASGPVALRWKDDEGEGPWDGYLRFEPTGTALQIKTVNTDVPYTYNPLYCTYGYIYPDVPLQAYGYLPNNENRPDPAPVRQAEIATYIGLSDAPDNGSDCPFDIVIFGILRLDLVKAS